jgi:hypothetical protein
MVKSYAANSTTIPALTDTFKFFMLTVFDRSKTAKAIL